MPLYKIEYYEDDEKKFKEIEAENDFWAEDVAYSLADKGFYEVQRKVIDLTTVAGEYWEFAFDSYTSTSRKFKLVDNNYVAVPRRRR